MGNNNSTSNGTDGKGGTIQQKITPIYSNWKNKKDYNLFVEYELGSNVYTCCYAQLTEIPIKIYTSRTKSINGAFTNSEEEQVLVEEVVTSTDDNEKLNSSTKSKPPKSKLTSLSRESSPSTSSSSLNSSPNTLSSSQLIEENPYLETLILDFNKITHISENINLLVNLKSLSLASNKITEIPDFIGKFKLESLQIGLNPLSSFPHVVCTITTLTVLHLESNQLTSIPDEFINLVNLKVLSLMDNLLKTIPSSLPGSIEKLNLSCNEIESTESESIQRFAGSLVNLNLSENNIKSLDPSFRFLGKLQTLILDCNHIVELPSQVIEGMQSLVTLNIPHNNILTLPAEIIKLTSFKVLDLRGNPIEIIKSKPKEMSSTSAFDIEDFIQDKENLTRIQLEQLEVIINTPDTNDENVDNSNNSNTTKKENNNQKIIFWQSLSPDLIIDNLYLGCRECAIHKNWLKANNVTHILTVAHFKPLYPDHFAYKCINIDDVEYEDIGQYFDEIVEFIDQGRKQGGVLVHCRAGVSRSATSVIAYLMAKLNLSYQEAFNQTSKNRPRICPNSGFTQQLKDYEQTLTNNNNNKK